jgi:hypothetical protein
VTATLRPELGALPARLARLPLDARGYPVPWFVQWIDGKPEFRVMDGEKFAHAIKRRRCWACGDALGAYMTFVIGPMCAVNRTSAEPPCHHECATWSARFCPFLSRPKMVRREDDLTEACAKGEAALDRNPGVAGLWTTRGYRPFEAKGASATGWLIKMGDPTRVEWYCEGRPATRAEVEASIDSGLPSLRAMCDAERDALRRLDAHAELTKLRSAVDRYLPAGIVA